MMRLPAAVLLLIASNVIADDAAAKKMLKDLEGNYGPVSMTRAGEPAPGDFLKTVSFSIKGDIFNVRFKKGDAGEDKAASIVLDPTRKPMTIDLTPKDGPDAGKPMLGIVKVEKETVTLCWHDRGEKSERPKDFTSSKDNKNFLVVMKKSR